MKNIKQKLQEDLREAVKKKEELRTSVLRMLNSAIHNREIEKKTKLRKTGEITEQDLIKKGQLTDEEITETIFSEIKKRKEAISEFEKGKREDLVEKEKKEIEILEKYMPEQLTEEDIKKLAKEIIEKLGAREMRDMGKVMGQIIPKIKGKAEGSVISRIVKELLTPETE